MTRRWWVVLGLLLLSLVILPIASAARGGTERPVQSAMSGLVTFEFDWSNALCPVTTISEATGTMSHLGQVSSSWSHCPPVGHVGYTNGQMLITAANGDTLTGVYEDMDGESPFTIEVTGGTGRFDGASGTLTLWFDAVGEWGEDGLPIQPWSWSAVMSGKISY